jgi:hypothetical protein
VHVAVADDLRPGEQLGPHFAGQRIGRRIETVWRDRAEIDHVSPIGTGRMDDQKADPTEAAVPRLDRRQRKSCGDDGIDGGAAGCQDLGADPGCGPVLRGDDTTA